MVLTCGLTTAPVKPTSGHKNVTFQLIRFFKKSISGLFSYVGINMSPGHPLALPWKWSVTSVLMVAIALSAALKRTDSSQEEADEFL